MLRGALVVSVLAGIQVSAPAAHADPIVCPFIALAAPGVPGVVDVDPEGDIWVVSEPFWDCPPYDEPGDPSQPPPPPATGHVTIHRWPGEEPKLLAAPTEGGSAWACYDVRSGGRVGVGAILRGPHPGVVCYPPTGYSPACNSVRAGGYVIGGAVEVRSACNGLEARQSLTASVDRADPPAYTTRYGSGQTPWSCTVSETVVVPTTDYWAFCDINVA